MFKKIHQLFKHHYHTRYHGVYRHAKQLFIFDLALLGTTIVLLGSGIFFLLWKPGIVDLIDVTLSLNNKRIKSGDIVQLTAEYTNRSKITLLSPTLAIHLPKGFVVDRDKTPEDVFSKNSIFKLSNIEPGGKGKVVINGRFWSEPDQDEKIIGVLSYNTEGRKDIEQKLTSFLAHLPESILKDTLTVATTTFPKQKIPFTYSLINNGDIELKNISINIDPENTLTSNGQNDFKNFNLKPGEQKNIKGEIISHDKQGKQTIVIESQVEANDSRIAQTKSTGLFNVILPQINSTAKILPHGAFAEPADTIPVEISWKNNSQFYLSEMRLKINFTPGVVDVQKLAKDSGFQAKDNYVLIDKTMRTALSNGNPGGQDTFTLNIPLLNNFLLGRSEKTSLSIEPVMEAQTAEISGQVFEQPGDTSRIPLATEASLKTEVRYFTAEGDQIGRGPLPPKVGEPTKYWIFVHLVNTTNALINNSFEASLSSGVSFTGKQSVTIGDPLRIENGKVIWNFPEIPANSQVGLYFEVSVTPNPSQIGRNISLIRDFSFDSEDSYVGKKFNLNGNGLSNILSASDRGSRMGSKVVE
jgi:hypothetical protein